MADAPRLRCGRGGRIALAAVLLAAGRGSRIGDRPKCLLEFDGMSLIRRMQRACVQAGIDEVVVVLGHHAELIEPQLPAAGTRVVRNPDPERGQVSSQRLGLAAVEGTPDAVFVALADQPLITAEDFVAMICAWKKRDSGVSVLVPQVDGERGNPVLLGASVRAEILAAEGGFGGRQWQAANPRSVAPFVTSNRNYRFDIDTPDDCERFERETGRALRWPAGLGR
jgi:CTP:molybdopterin cytidylyltransferase MocA